MNAYNDIIFFHRGKYQNSKISTFFMFMPSMNMLYLKTLNKIENLTDDNKV